MSTMDTKQKFNIVITHTPPYRYSICGPLRENLQKGKKLKTIKRTQKAKNGLRGNWLRALNFRQVYDSCIIGGLLPDDRAWPYTRKRNSGSVTRVGEPDPYNKNIVYTRKRKSGENLKTIKRTQKAKKCMRGNLLQIIKIRQVYDLVHEGLRLPRRPARGGTPRNDNGGTGLPYRGAGLWLSTRQSVGQKSPTSAIYIFSIGRCR